MENSTAALPVELQNVTLIIGEKPKEWQAFYDHQILTAENFSEDDDLGYMYHLAQQLLLAGLVKEKTAAIIYQHKQFLFYLNVSLLTAVPFLLFFLLLLL